MRALVLLLVLATPTLAGAPRYHAHTLLATGGSCPVGAPGVAPDGAAWGISLSGLAAWKATVCPEAGQTLSGTGTLAICTYSAAPWGPGAWALSALEIDMGGKASTLTHPCIELPQYLVGVALSDRIFLLPDNVGVSGGLTVTVYLTGESR